MSITIDVDRYRAQPEPWRKLCDDWMRSNDMLGEDASMRCVSVTWTQTGCEAVVTDNPTQDAMAGGFVRRTITLNTAPPLPYDEIKGATA